MTNPESDKINGISTSVSFNIRDKEAIHFKGQPCNQKCARITPENNEKNMVFFSVLCIHRGEHMQVH